MISWHKASVHDRVYCTTIDGKKLSMPRYYKDKIYTHDERLIIKACFTGKMAEEEAKFQADPNYERLYHERECSKVAEWQRHKFKSKNEKQTL